MIYSSIPSDWKDLQDKVTDIFLKIGFETEIESDIDSARGTVNIDVYAIDNNTSPPVVYLCECKFWNRAIPQTVIHSFRTVISDIGANFGFIISKEGFQAGSYNAAEFTNTLLVDWYEFQEYFEDRWFRDYMGPRIYSECYPLIDYTEPINSKVFRAAEMFDETEMKQFIELRSKYWPIAYYAISLHIPGMLDMSRKPDLPLINHLPPSVLNPEISGFIPEDILEVDSLDSFLELLIKICKEGILAFDELFGEPIRHSAI